MSRLIIGNQLTEETVEGGNAVPDDYKRMLGQVAHRLIWLANPGDVIVLPSAPDKDFAAHVWRVLGIEERIPEIVVPPPGRLGSDLLYDDRYEDSSLLATLRELVAVRGITQVLPFYFDHGVVALAQAIGLDGAGPGFGFLAEGGNEIVNTKSFFRILATGVSAPIPYGRSIASRDAAVEFIWGLLIEGKSAIVKQDVYGGGFGNEIFTTTADLNGIGANETLVFTDRRAVRKYLAANWDRYTQDGKHRVVAEHYVHEAVPIYIEIDVSAEHVATVGYGEMRMKPINNGLIVPPPSACLPSFPGFHDDAHRIGEAVRAMGYRGRMSIDAIVTPNGSILFNEFNGRIGGSTHIHLIGERLVGPDYLTERILIARNRCRWPSVAAALTAIEDNGLAFDRVRRTGVIVSGDDGQCLIVAETTERALAMERAFVIALELEES